MRIRLRGPSGASTLNVQDDATVSDLRFLITEKTSLNKFEIKYGYPPKPLQLGSDTTKLSELNIRLDGEQLIISTQDGQSNEKRGTTVDLSSGQPSKLPVTASSTVDSPAADSVLFAGIADPSKAINSGSSEHNTTTGLLSLKRRDMEMEVPELPLPDRGATLVLRVMPDDNSCFFRAFGTAVLPGDDRSVTELRSLVASRIQAEPEVYTQVVLEQKPDDYCRWIQTEDAWGGAIEMGILAQYFDIEICSIDVQSLRADRFNEGSSTRCILCYSGIHYDIVVQSPSDPPHTRANYPPEMDNRVWDAGDEYIVNKAKELCKKLQDQHYYTDTGGMALKCETCGWVGYGQGQAQTHAQQSGHYDMNEVDT